MDNCNIMRRHGYEPLGRPDEMLNLIVRGVMFVDVDLDKLKTDTNPLIPESKFNEKHFLLTESEELVLVDWFKLDCLVTVRCDFSFTFVVFVL